VPKEVKESVGKMTITFRTETAHPAQNFKVTRGMYEIARLAQASGKIMEFETTVGEEYQYQPADIFSIAFYETTW
jgi:hypothetical protein